MEYDAVIIGTGQVGPPLAMSLSEKGKTLASIEKTHLGGTCGNISGAGIRKGFSRKHCS